MGKLNEFDPDKITQALERIAAESKTRVDEISSRMMAVEQKLVRGDGSGDTSDEGRGSQGGLVFKTLFMEPSFEAVRLKRVSKSERRELQLSIKALVSGGSSGNTADGLYQQHPDRMPGLFGWTRRPLGLLDVVTAVPVTGTNKVEYARVSWEGDADAQDHEGERKSLMRFDTTIVESPLATIAVLADVSTQILDDVDWMEQELGTIMQTRVRDRFEYKMIAGTGTGGDPLGLLAQATLYSPTYNTPVDQIAETISTMVDQGYMPGAIVMNARDWLSISLERDLEERYQFGPPTQPVRPSISGVPVIQSSSLSVGTVLVLDLMQVRMFDRMRPVFAISFENNDNFERNLATLRVEGRFGVGVLDTLGVRKINIEAASE